MKITKLADTPQTYPPLRAAKITFDNGDTITTDLAAGLSDQEILDYYAVGRQFNLGRGGDDLMAKVTAVQILK